MDLAALLELLPEPARTVVSLLLQLIAVFTVAVPILAKLAKLTPNKRDDAAVSGLQRALSLFPRVVVPAVSLRPPPPARVTPAEITAAVQAAAAGEPVRLAQKSPSTVIVPPSE